MVATIRFQRGGMRRHWLRAVVKWCLILLTVMVIASSLTIAVLASRYGLTFRSVLSFVSGQYDRIRQTNDRTSILILGARGSGEAADLTDTMMVVSYGWDTASVALISVPRDIWSESLQDKVNSAYHYGEEMKAGGGPVLAKATVEEVIGMPIHYTVSLDFAGFVRIVDALGGIDVNISQPFRDEYYPVDGRENDVCGGDPAFRCRYATVEFSAGLQRFSGDQALSYVRSRHASGAAGSDFARMARQQEIIDAIKRKMHHLITGVDGIRMIPTVFQAIRRSLETDLNVEQVLLLARFHLIHPNTAPHRIPLEDLVTEAPISTYGRYVLVPKGSHAEFVQSLQERIQQP